MRQLRVLLFMHYAIPRFGNIFITADMHIKGRQVVNRFR